MKRLWLIVVAFLAMVLPFSAARAQPVSATMSGCQTFGIIFSGGKFGSQAGCSTAGGVVNTIQAWVECNSSGVITRGNIVSTALLRSTVYCPTGQSVSAYGYRIT